MNGWDCILRGPVDCFTKNREAVIILRIPLRSWPLTGWRTKDRPTNPKMSFLPATMAVRRLGAPQRWYPHRCAHCPHWIRSTAPYPPTPQLSPNDPNEPKLTGLTTHVGWRASTKRPPSSSGSRNQEYLMHLASRLRRSGVSSGEDPEGDARFSLDRFRKFIVLILFSDDVFPL